jgi:hypothetical protein
MGLFSGLGGGLGKAAGGFFQGGIAAEKEDYRRGQAEQDREYKKQLLAGRKKAEKDPHAGFRKRAGQMAQLYAGKLSDLQNQGLINDPKFRPTAQALRMAIQHGLDIEQGLIPPEQWNTSLFRLDPANDIGDDPQAAEAQGSPLGARTRLPFLQDVPGSGMAPPQGALGGLEPMRDEWSGGADIPWDAPLEAPAPARIGPSDISASLRPAPAQPKPETAAERLQRIEQQGPRPVERGYMTDPQWRAAQQQSVTEWQAAMAAAERAALIESKAQEAAAKAKIAGSDAAVRPELNRQKPIKGIVDIQKGRADRDLAIATTPIKVAKGKVDVQKAKQDVELAPKRLQVQQEGLEHRKEIDWARLRQQDKQFQAREARSERALSLKSDDRELPALQSLLRTYMQEYQKTVKTAAGSDVFAVRDAARQELGAKIDATSKRIQAIADRKPTTRSETVERSTRTSTGKSGKVPVGVLGKKPSAARLPKGVNDREYRAVAGLIGKGSFDNFARGLQGTDRARAKAIYRHKTGRDWGG